MRQVHEVAVPTGSIAGQSRGGSTPKVWIRPHATFTVDQGVLASPMMPLVRQLSATEAGDTNTGTLAVKSVGSAPWAQARSSWNDRWMHGLSPWSPIATSTR